MSKLEQISRDCQVDIEDMTIIRVDGKRYVEFDITKSDCEFAFETYDIIQTEDYKNRIEF